MKLQAVQVEVKELSILSVEGDRTHFHARVASGTYMRSIAHEMGQALGCGAHLESLRRTSVAEFDIRQAHTLEEIEGHPPLPAGNPFPSSSLGKGSRPRADFETFFVHPRQLLPHLPCVTADESTVARIRNGRSINLPELSQARLVKVFAGQRVLLAIATRVAGTLFQPKIVFPES